LRETFTSVLDKTESLGATYAEIRSQKNNNTLINVRDGQVEAVTLAIEMGGQESVFLPEELGAFQPQTL
jgi:predicted Zn-dependent protease